MREIINVLSAFSYVLTFIVCVEFFQHTRRRARSVRVVTPSTWGDFFSVLDMSESFFSGIKKQLQRKTWFNFPLTELD